MGFNETLRTAGPAADRAEKMALYGWLIGDWTMDATVYADDGTAHAAQGTIHFGWVLQGRAIQDVWILPGFFHGTTLRIYDPKLDAWHILWSDPLKQYFTRQIGRGQGKDIVQEGRNDSGELTRWSFTDIAPASFRWTRRAVPRRRRHLADAGGFPCSPRDRAAAKADARSRIDRSAGHTRGEALLRRGAAAARLHLSVR